MGYYGVWKFQIDRDFQQFLPLILGYICGKCQDSVTFSGFCSELVKTDSHFYEGFIKIPLHVTGSYSHDSFKALIAFAHAKE